MKKEVIEHQVSIYQCNCGKKCKPQFPDQINAPTQYGKSLKSLLIYFNMYQMVPLKRCTEFVNEVFGMSLSEASIIKYSKSIYTKLNEFDMKIKQKLMSSRLIHVDETGVNINGKNKWIHIVTNDECTYSEYH